MRQPLKHDRTHFYKYTTLETALKVISSRSFRWSSPLAFNDPFDNQAGFSFERSGDKYATATLEAMVRVACGGVDLKKPTLFGSLARLFGQIEGMSPDRVRQAMAETLPEMAERFEQLMPGFVEEIQGHLLNSRVLCVSEKCDNVVMWSHYADSHKGVVFKLRCIDEIDNTLLAARKVDYGKEFITFPGPDEYAKHCTGEEPIDLEALAWDICYRKHEDWAYEKEWRVIIPLLGAPTEELFSLEHEHPAVFDEVYLGCRMDAASSAAVIGALSAHLPHVKAYRAVKNPSYFGLDFLPT
jgi:hypothetical protein